MSSSKNFVQPSIPKFDSHYDFWSMKMENFLRSIEMRNLIDEGISVPTIEILETIRDKRSSKLIWESMRQKYQGSTKVKGGQLQALRKEFELLAMWEGKKIDTFLCRTLSVVNKMSLNGEEMLQSTSASKMLRSLTPKFNYVVFLIEESNDFSTLTIDELHGSLGREGQGICGRGCGRGRQPYDKSIIECHNFHKLCHFQYECPDIEKRANYVEMNEDEEFLLMSCVESETYEDDDLLLEEVLLMSQE
ncbi:hypothetical protein Tco_1044184 [Tanacetum coccineum]|uniref:Retrovirus-related Pol polyprotein from transposon TNT 1-94 n=1 Tax=Tanacetum coccineum TaxID=301880 RepID=A0ABQ5GQ68_9ASTR